MMKIQQVLWDWNGTLLDDLEYSIVLYGLFWYPDCDEQECLYEKLLSRGGFWPSFAYLAAWNDRPRAL